MQTVNEEISNNTGKKIIYVGLNNNGYSNTNGFLAIDNITRGVDLSLFGTEKYRQSPLDLVPGTLKHVQISKNVEAFSNEQVVLKLILDSNFQVLSSEYVRENGDVIESILTDKVSEKISGIYPGAFKSYQKDFSKLSEADVFILVNKVIQMLENAYFNGNKSSITPVEQTEWEYAFDFCLAHLARFGVEQHFDVNTKRMEETPTFKAWYQWWYEYFEVITSDSELSSLFYEKQRNCQNLEMFRPNGTFDKYLDNGVKKEKQKRKVINKSGIEINTQEKVS